jgi:glutamyl-tRNA synthetase
MLKERLHFAADLWEEGYFFFEAPQSYDKQVINKRWKADTASQMQALHQHLETLDAFETELLDQSIKQWIEVNGYGMGAVMNALRLLLVGTSKGPHLADIMALIGKEESLERIQKGVAIIEKQV